MIIDVRISKLKEMKYMKTKTLNRKNKKKITNERKN